MIVNLNKHRKRAKDERRVSMFCLTASLVAAMA
jgi:hypothetical protein